jgi:hypothetical protein
MDSTAEGMPRSSAVSRYPALHVVDLAAEGAAVTEPYRKDALPKKFDGKFAASCVGSTDLSGHERTDRRGRVL